MNFFQNLSRVDKQQMVLLPERFRAVAPSVPAPIFNSGQVSPTSQYRVATIPMAGWLAKHLDEWALVFKYTQEVNLLLEEIFLNDG